MPKLGLTMTEGVLSDWLVKPGARFYNIGAEGQLLAGAAALLLEAIDLLLDGGAFTLVAAPPEDAGALLCLMNMGFRFTGDGSNELGLPHG